MANHDFQGPKQTCRRVRRKSQVKISNITKGRGKYVGTVVSADGCCRRCRCCRRHSAQDPSDARERPRNAGTAAPCKSRGGCCRAFLSPPRQQRARGMMCRVAVSVALRESRGCNGRVPPDSRATRKPRGGRPRVSGAAAPRV